MAFERLLAEAQFRTYPTKRLLPPGAPGTRAERTLGATESSEGRHRCGLPEVSVARDARQTRVAFERRLEESSRHLGRTELTGESRELEGLLGGEEITRA